MLYGGLNITNTYAKFNQFCLIVAMHHYHCILSSQMTMMLTEYIASIDTVD